MMVLAIKDLFGKIRQRSCDGSHVVHLSYLEVYNETVRDLLCLGRPLVLGEDKQVMTLLQQGNHNRTIEPTRVNETSLRSHAILQVVVEYRVRDATTMSIVNRVGKLSLIDLAGSERALSTDQRTLRSFEGANINRSLFVDWLFQNLIMDHYSSMLQQHLFSVNCIVITLIISKYPVQACKPMHSQFQCFVIFQALKLTTSWDKIQ